MAEPVGPDPVVVEHGTHLEVTWRNGRGEWFLCSPEVIESDVATINELRATVRENGQAIAAALRIHRPCHTNVSDEPCHCGASTAHCLPANEPRCGVCLVDNGPEEWTYEVWPCATAQALGATR